MKKNSLQRILSLVFVFVFVFTNWVNADNLYSDSERTQYENHIKLFQKLGIVDEIPELTKTVTRSEYAKILVSLASGAYGISEDTETGFSDVNFETKNAEYIYSGVTQGILSGYSDGTFRPDAMITAEEAVSGFVKAMGYKMLAEKNGGYPSGYLFMANKIKLISGVDLYISYDLTYASLIKMAVNSLGINFLEARYSNTGVYYEEGINRFAENLGIEKRSGIIDGTKYTYLTNDSRTAENVVSIDETNYITTESYNDLLGYNVEFYINTLDGKNEIIYINKKSDINKELIISADDLADYSNRKYTYYENNKKKTLALPTKISIIYNSVCEDEPTDAMMEPVNGEIKFVDNNSDGKYDVLFITNYETWIVKSVNERDKKIYDMYKTGSLDLSDAENCFIRDISGKDLHLSELRRYSVLTVKESANAHVVEITVNSRSVRGKITRLYDEEIMIDETRYKLLPVGFNGSLDLGKTGTLLIDCNGTAVAFIDNTVGGMSVGYLIDVGLKDGLEPILRVKLFSSEEKMLVFECKEKIKIDGSSGKKAAEALTALKKGGTEVEPQIILYRLNDEGLITEIDTPYNSKNDLTVPPGVDESVESLRVLKYIVDANDDVIWQRDSRIFNGKTAVTEGFSLFNVPGDPKTAHEREFSIINMNSLAEQPVCTSLELYSADKNKMIASIGVMNGASGGSKPGGTKYGIISESITILEDDMLVQQHTIMGEHGSVTAKLEPDDIIVNNMSSGEELGVGDFVEYYADSSGYINWIKLWYDASKGPAGNTVTSGIYWAEWRVAFGYVYSREADVIGVSLSPITGSVDESTLDVQNLVKYNKIMSYDAEREEVYSISAGEIMDYKSSVDGEFTKIVYVTNQGRPIMMVCYE